MKKYAMEMLKRPIVLVTVLAVSLTGLTLVLHEIRSLLSEAYARPPVCVEGAIVFRSGESSKVVNCDPGGRIHTESHSDAVIVTCTCGN